MSSIQFPYNPMGTLEAQLQTQVSNELIDYSLTQIDKQLDGFRHHVLHRLWEVMGKRADWGSSESHLHECAAKVRELAQEFMQKRVEGNGRFYEMVWRFSSDPKKNVDDFGKINAVADLSLTWEAYIAANNPVDVEDFGSDDDSAFGVEDIEGGVDTHAASGIEVGAIEAAANPDEEQYYPYMPGLSAYRFRPGGYNEFLSYETENQAYKIDGAHRSRLPEEIQGLVKDVKNLDIYAINHDKSNLPAISMSDSEGYANLALHYYVFPEDHYKTVITNQMDLNSEWDPENPDFAHLRVYTGIVGPREGVAPYEGECAVQFDGIRREQVYVHNIDGQPAYSPNNCRFRFTDPDSFYFYSVTKVGDRACVSLHLKRGAEGNMRIEDQLMRLLFDYS